MEKRDSKYVNEKNEVFLRCVLPNYNQGCNLSNLIQSTLGFATMGKAANLCLATRNAVTDLF